MRHVPRPKHCPKETYKTTVSKVKNPTLKTQLNDVLDTIVSASKNYAFQAERQKLHSITTTTAIGMISATEFVKNYDNRFAKKKSAGRHIYDDLKSLPDGDICPYCNHRDISTLDHFLPKAHFPALAVTPENLIGACSDCNKTKKDDVPSSLEQTFIHPYFENISDSHWLHAEVIQDSPPAVKFFVQPPDFWNKSWDTRVKLQFRTLGLAELYSKQAARELNDIRAGLKMHYEALGSIRVQQELYHQWSSRKTSQMNSWQTAFYDALTNSSWFYEGGFLQT